MHETFIEKQRNSLQSKLNDSINITDDEDLNKKSKISVNKISRTTGQTFQSGLPLINNTKISIAQTTDRKIILKEYQDSTYKPPNMFNLIEGTEKQLSDKPPMIDLKNNSTVTALTSHKINHQKSLS